MKVEPGPGFVARLRQALRDAAPTQRILIHTGPTPQMRTNQPPPLAEEGSVGVYTLPMSDTVKEVVNGRVRRTVPRETLVDVTGPWIFDHAALADVLTAVAGREADIPDMIGLCEAARIRARALPVR